MQENDKDIQRYRKEGHQVQPYTYTYYFQQWGGVTWQLLTLAQLAIWSLSYSKWHLAKICKIGPHVAFIRDQIRSARNHPALNERLAVSHLGSCCIISHHHLIWDNLPEFTMVRVLYETWVDHFFISPTWSSQTITNIKILLLRRRVIGTVCKGLKL